LFNNREIAAAIWLTLFAVGILSKSEIRASIAGVVRSFFAWKLLACFAAMTLYTASMILVLYAVGFWQFDMTKDTALWFFTASAMVLRFMTSHKPDSILRDVLIENVKLIIFLEFIMETYVMPLPAELVAFPVVTTLTLIMTVAQSNEKHATAARLSTFLLGAVGFFVLGFAIWRAIGDYRSLGTMATVRGIAFPPLMSILLVPFIYVMTCFVYYDDIFIRLKVGSNKAPTVLRYAKRRMFSHCGLSLSRLRNLRSCPQEIMRIESNEDVDRLLRSTNPVSLTLFGEVDKQAGGSGLGNEP
jgi:hypothetical protein